jgi:hypothetical protein
MLESMPSLETATVRFDHFYDDRCSNGRLDDCGDASCYGCLYYYAPDDYDCVFLEGLAEVTDLTLSAYPDLVCLQLLPMFSVMELYDIHSCISVVPFESSHFNQTSPVVCSP